MNMIEQILKNYYFVELRKQVKRYVNMCKKCNKNKSIKHKWYKKLRTFTMSMKTWKSIIWNFIIKLSKFKESLMKTIYDAILIIKNQLTKYCYFLSYKKSFTIEDLTYTYLRVIVFKHDLSKKIISNRDKLFTSKFWTWLMQQLRIKHKLFTAFHSQTNDQTEWMNQTLKQYLLHYFNYKQNNWI